MRRFGVLPAGLSVLFLAASGLSGQSWIGDVRFTGALPTQRMAGTDLDPGVGLGATVAYRVQPRLFVYGGWDWLHLRADDSFAGLDRDFEETGYTLGLRMEHPTHQVSPVRFRAEGGATYKHVEIEASNGERVTDSGHGWGFETAAGLVFSFGESWRLTPTLRYRSLTPDFTIEGEKTEAELRYAAFDVALSYGF